MSPSMVLKKRIIDEVKMIIAGRKTFMALRMNQLLVEAFILKYRDMMVEAEKVIKRNLVAWYKKVLF